jgi:hypothetical protein
MQYGRNRPAPCPPGRPPSCRHVTSRTRAFLSHCESVPYGSRPTAHEVTRRRQPAGNSTFVTISSHELHTKPITPDSESGRPPPHQRSPSPCRHARGLCPRVGAHFNSLARGGTVHPYPGDDKPKGVFSPQPPPMLHIVPTGVGHVKRMSGGRRTRVRLCFVGMLAHALGMSLRGAWRRSNLNAERGRLLRGARHDRTSPPPHRIQSHTKTRGSRPGDGSPRLLWCVAKYIGILPDGSLPACSRPEGFPGIDPRS